MMNVLNILLFLYLGSFVQLQLTGDEILRRVEQQLAPVNDYTVDLEAEVNMDRLRIPKMKATMYFKKPDKVHFEAPGFAMLPREGVALNPTWLRERFDATVVGRDTIDGRIVQKLQLAAKDRKTRLRQLFVWIDAERWTVTKFETIPYEGRSLTVTFHHALQESRYWLPDTMSASFGFAAEEPDSLPGVYQYKPQLREMVGQQRGGYVKVAYSNYRMNTGLSDELFERKPDER
ncbi:MAG TPA: hypothetical protein VII11_12130 [Bacteroidota bacterium]